MKNIKKVKQFYLANKGISGIGIVSILISISYVLTYKLPDYFGIEPIYAWLNNIAISYVAAMIFFVVQVYIPEQKNKKHCMEVLKNNFIDLAKFLDLTILACKRHIKIKETGADLLWNSEEEKIYIKYSKLNDIKAFSIGSYTKSEISDLDKQFNKKIAKIKESPVIKFCDYELLEILTKVEASNFYKTLQRTVMLANTETNLQSFNDAMNDLQELDEEMKNVCMIDVDYQLYEIDEMDKIYADLPRNNIVKSLISVRGVNIESEKKNIRKQLNEQGVSLSDEQLNEIAQVVVDTKLQNYKNGKNLPR